MYNIYLIMSNIIIVIVKRNLNYYHILIYLLHNHVDMSTKSK